MSDHAKLLRRLNIKLQGRTTAIGGSDPILLIASRTLADAAEHIDQLIRERDGLLDGRTQAEGQRNDAEAEARKSAAECIRLQAENERLNNLLDAEPGSGPFCTYCKTQFPGMTWEGLQQHVRECEEHPLCKAIKDLAALKSENERLMEFVAEFAINHQAAEKLPRVAQCARAILASKEQDHQPKEAEDE